VWDRRRKRPHLLSKPSSGCQRIRGCAHRGYENPSCEQLRKFAALANGCW
jgi:hypothetical protein